MDIKIVTANYLQFTKSKADKRWASVFWNRVCLLKPSKVKSTDGGGSLSLNMVCSMLPNPNSPATRHSNAWHSPPTPTITSTPPSGQSLQFRTYNSRRLSVWKSCQESVVSRLLDKFLQKLTNKGVFKGQSQQQECPPWRTWLPGGRLGCTSFSSPNFAC